MIKVVARKHSVEGKFDEIMELEKELIEKTRMGQGNICYELYRDVNDRTTITMIEEWESEEDLKRHMNSEHFKRLVPLINKFMVGDTDMNIYEKVM